MSVNRSLIAPSSNPRLEAALRDKLRRRAETTGRLGELEPLAIRLGLMQNTLKPAFQDPQLVIFAADHGLATDGLPGARRGQTQDQVQQLLAGQWPMAVFARTQAIELSVVDCGIAAQLAPHERLLARKIAHGTRNARVSAAMSIEQAHAGMRAGMEIGDSLRGNMLICAGLGIGAEESAALVLSRLTDTPVRDLVVSGPLMSADRIAHLMVVLQAAQTKHANVSDPVEVMAAFGGFELAVMVGVMLVAASKRHLLMADGISACAALMVASRIAAPVIDYSVFCRSSSHHGLDRTLGLFNASALLELGLESADGTGATLAWPLVRGAAALLTEVADGDDAGPTLPGGIPQAEATVLDDFDVTITTPGTDI